MKLLEVTLSITISVEVDDRATEEDVQEAVENEVNRHSDGRHSFSSEMVRNGAANVINHARSRAVWCLVDRLAKKYPALDPNVSRDAWQRRDKLEEGFSYHAVGGWTGDVAVSVSVPGRNVASLTPASREPMETEHGNHA